MNMIFKIYKITNRDHSINMLMYDMLHQITLQNKKYSKQYSTILLDFENLKKRNIIESQTLSKSANKEIVKHLLVILDDLENALISIGNKKILKHIQDGLALITRNFFKILKRYGLTPINALGTKFNHLKHEAIRNKHISILENDMIIEEYQKGYTLNNKLLRASKVMVNLK